MPISDNKALALLAEDEGMSVYDLVDTYVLDSVQPGICVTTGCGYTSCRMEPDQDQGWCEECGAGTVKSVGILAGF